MTNLQDLSPNLMVKDVNKSIEFYTNLLHFQKIATVPESGDLQWGMVKSGNVSFMFQKIESIQEEYPQVKDTTPGGTLTFYIHVNDLQALFDDLQKKVKVIKQIEKKPYGALEFAIEDCNGYILVFSQAGE